MRNPARMSLFVLQIVACCLLLVVVSAKKASHQVAGPSPAPAPAPAFVNLTDLLSVAGPFTKFLSLLESTGVIPTLQTQANNTDTGLTLFVPKDSAFAAVQKNLSKLSSDQLKNVALAHAISKFYTLTDFQTFPNPATTMAGGNFKINITSSNGAVSVSSGYWTVPIASTVYVTHPAGIYSLGKVLLPEGMFGVASPAATAPAPSPAQSSAPSKSPKRSSGSSSSSKSTSPSASPPSSPSAASFLQIPRPLFVATTVVFSGFLFLVLL